MKKLICILFVGLSVAFASCDKGDIEIKKLNRGSGTWAIESMRYETFDSAGVNVISTSTVENPGELIFFESATLNALFAHHMVVATMFDTSGAVIANPGRVFYDGDRVWFGEDPDASHNFPNELEGIWTVNDDGRKSQEWNMYYVNSTTGLLETKISMFLKKIK
jgi:hypothetical protein